MSVSRNIVANIAGTAWNGLLTLLTAPVYVSLLGLEGYGLVGFWIFLQVALSWLDFGMGPALIREFAGTDSGTRSSEVRGNLLRTLEYLYWGVAALVVVVIFSSAGWISIRWLEFHVIPPTKVAASIRWMALALGLQFPCGLYSNGLVGLQRQIKLNTIQALAVTGRHLGGVLVLVWTGDLVFFFMFQCVNLLVQTTVTRFVLHSLLRADASEGSRFSPVALRSVWRFSVGMGVTMIAGVGLANIDRLFVSASLPAAQMGKYTLAATAAAMTQLGVQPFYRAYFPRWSELYRQGRDTELRAEYYRGCRWVGVLLVPISLAGVCFAPQIFFVWTGTVDLSVVAIFRWLLVGMSAAGLMWLPAALQQAQGWTSLHAGMLIGALGIGVVVLPWSIHRWGVAGATAVWVLHGTSDLTLGLWLMHRRILRRELVDWYRQVVGVPLILSVPVFGIAWASMPVTLGRPMAAVWIGGTTVLVLGLVLAYDNRQRWSAR